MKITFYRSNLCPRCYVARKNLYELTATKADIEIEEVDFLLHPIRCWKEGVRLIPALKRENTLLSGVFLTRKEIEEFINA